MNMNTTKWRPIIRTVVDSEHIAPYLFVCDKVPDPYCTRCGKLMERHGTSYKCKEHGYIGYLRIVPSFAWFDANPDRAFWAMGEEMSFGIDQEDY